MSLGRTIAITRRIILQIVRDHRTLALITIAPLVVMTLVGLTFSKEPQVLNYAAPALLAASVLFFVFILTGVSFLRERLQGTLERLQATPASRWDVLIGYLLGFLTFAALQALIILFYTIYIFDIQYQGALWEIFLFLLVVTVTSVNLGIFISTFARNEFQVVQFIPLILMPQVFLSGILLPTAQMPGYLQALSKVLPLTYAVDGLRRIMLSGQGLGEVGWQLAVLSAFAVVMLGLAAATIRR